MASECALAERRRPLQVLLLSPYPKPWLQALGGSTGALSSSGGRGSRGAAGGRRGALTLRDLVEAGITPAGRSKITVVYKGVTYTASLGHDGLILYQGAPQCKAANLATRWDVALPEQRRLGGLVPGRTRPRWVKRADTVKKPEGKVALSCNAWDVALMRLLRHCRAATGGFLLWLLSPWQCRCGRPEVCDSERVQHPLQAPADARQAGRRRLEERAVRGAAAGALPTSHGRRALCAALALRVAGRSGCSGASL